jgi:two-component system chemotaxis response regulator CheY
MFVPGNRPALVVGEIGIVTILLTRTLRILGCSQVDRTLDVQSAIERLRLKSYSVIVSAIEMEPLDGFALLRSVRNDSDMASTPFVFVSGEISAEFKKRARAAGATGYILKTSSPFEIAESIKYAVNVAPGAPFRAPHCLPALHTAEALLFGTPMESSH